MLRQLLLGAAAGAAGTTALNGATYLDMTVRGRPASQTPVKTVKTAADEAGTDIPGEGDTKENRASALGSLMGIATGVGLGIAYGGLRGLGVRLPTWAGGLLVGVAAMAGSTGPMAALGITDPKSWPASSWVTDIVPHLAYGAVTAATYAAAEH